MTLAAAATTTIQVQQPIHWEAVLITAVPATLALLGTIVAAVIGRANQRKLAEHVIPKLESVDLAVNGAGEGEPTLRENVQAVAEHVLPDRDAGTRPPDAPAGASAARLEANS